MNKSWVFCILIAFSVVSWQGLTPAAGCSAAPSQSGKSKVILPQGSSAPKWTAPTYRGLILGKSNKSQVEAIFGAPRWSGHPEEPAVGPSSDSELWYEYDGADGSPGRTTVVTNRTGVVVVVLVYPKKPLPLKRALELYGHQYIERKWSPCLTERERRQMKDKDRPPLDTFLVYPKKGMYLQRGEWGDISVIAYLLRCP